MYCTHAPTRRTAHVMLCHPKSHHGMLQPPSTPLPSPPSAHWLSTHSLMSSDCVTHLASSSRDRPYMKGASMEREWNDYDEDTSLHAGSNHACSCWDSAVNYVQHYGSMEARQQHAHPRTARMQQRCMCAQLCHTAAGTHDARPYLLLDLSLW